MTSTEYFAVGVPIQVASNTLLPIEKTTILCDPAFDLGCFYASKVLVALVVKTPLGVQAFDIESGAITVDELKRIAPEVETHLNS